MGKKLSEIREKVNSSSQDFLYFLRENLDEDVLHFLKIISEVTNTYIFSGIIRNFFLKINEIRDIDIILENEVELDKYLEESVIKKNSFGGYKILINDTKIDLWFLEKTWAFQNQKTLHFDLDKMIPSTAFFNFSAIIFSLNESSFYFKSSFCSFLRDKEINLVYKPNFNYSLCIINSFYYSDKYKLRIADKLKKHLVYISKYSHDYDEVQLKHFGKEIYSKKEIEKRIDNFKINLGSNKSKPTPKNKKLLF